MDTLTFERAFDPPEIDFYSEIDMNEMELEDTISDLSNTDDSTILFD